VQRARTLIYSTALPPMAAAVAVAAMDLIDEEPQRVARLGERIAEFRGAAEAAGLELLPSRTAIQPLVVGEAQTAVSASSRLAEQGFLVPAIRPPTVPEGTSRLRVSLCAEHAQADVQALARALAESLAA
jgi:8-amino-7-oxononanoate synthase